MRRTVCFAVCLALLFSFTVIAMADAENQRGLNHNEIIITASPSAPAVTSVQEIPEGIRLITATGEQNRIGMPDENNYFSTIQPMYIDAPKDHSVYVYWDEFGKRVRSDIYAYEGMNAYAVAVSDSGKYICIVFSDQQFNAHAGWVTAHNLSYTYPSTTKTSGMPVEDIGLSADDPILQWSDGAFVGTKQKYLCLEETIEDCIAFHLEYQVTGRGGMSMEDVLGSRTVYVNGGNGWVEAGTFDYPEIKANLITINLPYPMNVMAIAVKADCKAADVLNFRMSAFHFVKSLQSLSGGTQNNLSAMIDEHIDTRVYDGETYYLVDLSKLSASTVVGMRGLGISVQVEDIMGTGGSLAYLKLENPIKNCCVFALPIAVFGNPNFDFSDVTWCIVFKDGQGTWVITDYYDYVDGEQQFCGVSLDRPFDLTAITVVPYEAPHGFGDFNVQFTPTSGVVGFKDYASAAEFVKGIL